MNKLKIGVLGAGHLGKIHIRCIREIESYQLMGFYDPDEQTAAKVSEDFSLKAYHDIQSLIDDVDVVDIVTPTVEHFPCASRALRESRHVFIEKPIVATPDEARELMKLAYEANVKVQVGHVERFNPAFLAAKPYFNQPMFIEAHRLSTFNPRGLDVPVILDLMIHDLDIVLSLVKSNIRRVHASGVAIISSTPDIANARLEFENGCVANLTASRMSMKNMRKIRFFQYDRYLSVDFLDKKVEIIRIQDYEPNHKGPFDLVLDMGPNKPAKQFVFENPPILPVNAIKMELESFASAIIYDDIPPVTIQDGIDALNLAYQIMEKINA
ncbi:MAG TPA: Gfo/Idh/MocA family oxidoreductase [Bacteroidales bacterium]|jgi:predicted dehydrogenase|nr:Gfo/Idh/MocA family oxidoreductase [Bacteroidales bacterium]HQQ01914.1 Gfo/Idh/MocA family oxidoreductase [Bacteroidales bacterium]